MGSWGAGLYSSDLALDLRGTFAVLARLPLDGTRIVEIVSEMMPDAASDPANEEHPVFWIVVADQLHRRGIACEPARRKALELLAAGADESMQRALGMSEANLRKRAKSISEVRARLETLPLPPRCKPIAKPQTLVMDAGVAYAFPTCKGQPWNPYVNPARDQKLYRWTQDAWGALVVLDRGLAFDYLAWYRIAVSQHDFEQRPVLDDLWDAPWMRGGLAACTPAHVKRMQLQPVGDVQIDRAAFESAFGALVPATGAAVADSSIWNYMIVTSSRASDLANFLPSHQRTVPLRRFASP